MTLKRLPNHRENAKTYNLVAVIDDADYIYLLPPAIANEHITNGGFTKLGSNLTLEECIKKLEDLVQSR